MLGLALVLALTQTPQHRLFRQPNLPRGGEVFTPLSFSFAPSSGAGMGAVCACDGGITDLVGRPVAFTRATTAYCEKGSQTNPKVGELVLCPSGLPRVMPGGDGTGSLGLNVEGARTNQVLYSQKFDNAAWNALGATVAHGACAAPDGTATGALVAFDPSVSGVSSSVLYQASITGNNPSENSIYLCGVDGGTTIDAPCTYTGAVWSCTSCAIPWCGVTDGGFLPDGGRGLYTRCMRDNANAAQYFLFGNAGANGGATRPAVKVCAWGAQLAAGVSTTSYIPTEGSGVTRNADVAEVQFRTSVRTSMTLAASFVPENGLTAEDRYIVDVNNHTGVSGFRMSRDGSTLQCVSESGATATTVDYGTLLADGSAVLQCRYDGNSTLFACVDGACGDGGIQSAVALETAVTLGSKWSGAAYIGHANGVVKNVTIEEGATKDVYLFGDSIVEGNTAGDGAQPQFVIHSALGNRVAVNNLAESGKTSTECLADVLAQIDYVVDAGYQRRSFFMLQCGINSQPDAGGTLDDLKYALAASQDAGIRIIGSTVTPVLASAAYVQTVNDGLTAFGTAQGITISNTFSALEDPSTPGALNPLYDFGDNVHLNDAGTYVESVVWMNAGYW